MFSARSTARRLKAALLLLFALLLQGWTVYRLLLGARHALSSDWLLSCLSWQAVSALVAAPAAMALMPLRFRKMRYRTLPYLWLLMFSVPLGGLALSCGAIALGSLLPREPEPLAIDLIEMPQFVSQQPTVAYGRGAHLKSALLSSEASSSFRMTALMALQAMPMRTVSPLLHSMLDDRYEDIRLLAFWMFDRREKELTQKILQHLPKLDLGLSPSERYLVNKDLAMLYNELIYSYLVLGDVYRHALQQADQYAEQALAEVADDAALWRLRGRLAMDRGDIVAGEAMLEQAIEHGFERSRLLPYLAELAYLRRDYPEVTRLLSQIPEEGVLPVLKPALQFWSAPS